jgi:peptide/nickel transport system permease protein
MRRYVLSRLWGGLVVMFIVVTMVFFIVRMIPGDPAAIMLGPDATPQDVQQLRTSMGFNDSLPEQYIRFLQHCATGDLGTSIFLNKPVLSALADRAEPTFFLTLMAITIAMLVGIPAGVISATQRGRAADQLTVSFAMLMASLPSFWLGLMFMRVFSVDLGWFPVSGYGEPGAPLLQRLYHLVLPATVLGLISSALVTRFTRSSLLDVLGEDYVRTARAKGLSEFVVVMKHAFRNAFIPVLTVLGMTLALLLGGAVVTESVFNLPGVGNLVVSAVSRRDYPVIQGALMVIAAIYVLVNLLVDLTYALVDPRVRVGA